VLNVAFGKSGDVEVGRVTSSTCNFDRRLLPLRHNLLIHFCFHHHRQTNSKIVVFFLAHTRPRKRGVQSLGPA